MEIRDPKESNKHSSNRINDILVDRDTCKLGSNDIVTGNNFGVSSNSVASKSLLAERKNEEWGRPLEFLMSCIQGSIGLGNIWRFPFKAYDNGGGAFLIPYVIVLFLVGKPFYYLESLLGQFTSKSVFKTWSMVPAMRGLGFGQILVGFYIVSYYCSLMAITCWYFFASFQAILPWSYCREEWGTSCVDMHSKNTNFSAGVQSSAELYFRKIVINELDSIESGIGLPSWKLSLCLVVSWLSIFLVTCKGIKSSGKASYFLAIFPYVMMIILLIRAVTLKGSIDGIIFFITPKWEVLYKPQVWYAAITQCFFSLSVCLGPVITYSSHNNFKHRVNRDVHILTTLDTFTSLMAGCTIFGILGNLASEMGTNDISQVVRGGTGLAFISYPDALSRFAIFPQLFSVIFFVMMFVLGTGSAVSLAAGVCSLLDDIFPNVSHWKRMLVLCCIGYTVGLVYVTPGGLWFIDLVDTYGGTFLAIIVGVLEMVTVFWIYGLGKFLNDVEFMLGSRPGFYWRICWTAITPILMIVILIYTFIKYENLKYLGGISYPTYAYVIGWSLFIIGTVQIVIWIVCAVMKNKQFGLVQAIRLAFRPSSKWGPSNPKTKDEWNEFVYECKKNRKESTIFQYFFK